MADTGTGNTLPLSDLHEAANARFGPFAGWTMPIQYTAGVMKEHLHTREKAGLFDISHMRLFRVSGPDAAAFLSRLCPLDAKGIEQTRSRYTFFLNEQAGILDDLIATRLGADEYMVVANAGNAEADEAHMRAHAGSFDVSIEALPRIFLALQGPAAEAILSGAGLEVSDLVFMSGRETPDGQFIARSGYTGEDGFELALSERQARALLEKLLTNPDVAWIGLAARDSLRLEAGLCLHGQDITPDINPVDAGLMWAIPKAVRQAGGFLGAKALAERLAAGPVRRRVGLKPEGRQPVRAGVDLFDADGNPAGTVTSGGFGPSVGHPVAMGYVTAVLAEPGTTLFADVRGARVPVAVHRLPFVQPRSKKG